MKFPVSAIIAAAVLTAPASAATLAEVQTALQRTTSMTADFEQVAANGAVANGRVELKRPGRIRFDYGPKSRQLVVADGRTLSFIDYAVAQVSQWPIRQTPLGVLLDPQADLSKVARVLPAAQSPEPGVVAVLAQDPKKPEQGRILLMLKPDSAAPGGLRLLGWDIQDAQNNVTRVTLSNVRTNVPVNDSRFRFDDPRTRGKVPGRVG